MLTPKRKAAVKAALKDALKGRFRDAVWSTTDGLGRFGDAALSSVDPESCSPRPPFEPGS
jgi:hypothetical protein